MLSYKAAVMDNHASWSDSRSSFRATEEVLSMLSLVTGKQVRCIQTV